MDFFTFALATIAIITIIIIRLEKYFRIKKNGIFTEAEVLGYKKLYPPNFNTLYIALKFKDSTNKEKIILTEYAHVRQPFTYPSIYPYKTGTIIRIIYTRHDEDYKLDSSLAPITLLKSNKKIQPNDNGNIYEIEYLSRKNMSEYLLILIQLCIIIPLIIAIFI